MTKHPIIRSYQNARKLKRYRLHGRDTVLITESDRASIRYHHTNVVTHYADGSCILRSGGYETVTTKRRMNEYAPEHIRVYQRAYRWYVRNTATGQTVRFDRSFAVIVNGVIYTEMPQ